MTGESPPKLKHARMGVAAQSFPIAILEVLEVTASAIAFIKSLRDVTHLRPDVVVPFELLDLLLVGTGGQPQPAIHAVDHDPPQCEGRASHAGTKQEQHRCVVFDYLADE